jgi:hypothetical protein
MSSWEPKEGCVVNSGCSFRMCLRKKYFEILKLVEVVYLGDGKLCKVLGMRMVYLKSIEQSPYNFISIVLQINWSPLKLADINWFATYINVVWI